MKTKSSLRLLVCAVLPAVTFWLIPRQANAQNLLLNPSFEIGAPNTSGPVPSWTVGGTGNVVENNEGGASNGSYEAIFDAGSYSTGSTLSQSVATVIGTTYRLSLDATVYGPSNGTYSLIIAVTSTGGASLAGSTVTPTVSGFNGNIYNTYTFGFTATSLTTTLTLTDSDGGRNAQGSADMVVDNVSIVPEPSTWALLGVGAGALGVVTLRRCPRGA